MGWGGGGGGMILLSYVGACGLVDRAHWTKDQKIWGSIPTAGLEVLNKLVIPSCLCLPSSNGYLMERKS